MRGQSKEGIGGIFLNWLSYANRAAIGRCSIGRSRAKQAIGQCSNRASRAKKQIWQKIINKGWEIIKNEDWPTFGDINESGAIFRKHNWFSTKTLFCFQQFMKAHWNQLVWTRWNMRVSTLLKTPVRPSHKGFHKGGRPKATPPLWRRPKAASPCGWV